jgi:hypothetical protein
MYNNDTERLFAEGGMNDEGGTVDPVSGNDVPAGSLQNEVRDDIPAQLSEGEFVVPADVVRYIGLERLMKLRDEAKAGLARMNEIGQMGNAQEVENPEALHNSEDEGFESEIDDIMQEVESQQPEVKKFEAGGFAVPGTDLLSKYNIPKTSITNPALDVRAYKNAQGRVMYITFFNDKPSIAIPAGYEFAGSAGQFIAETKKTDDTKKDVVTATGTVESGGDGVSVGGGPAVGGSGPGTGTGIGNSTIGIAIGAIANAIDSITNPNPTPVSDVDAVTTTGVSTSANAAGLAESAAAISVDDASISEGVTGGVSSNGAPGVAGSTAATAAADNSGNTNSNDGGGSGTGGGGGGTGAGAGTGNAMAKGGLVAKRTKKPAPAQKRGIASKK